MFGLTMADVARYQKLEKTGFTTETMVAAGVSIDELDRLTVDELIAKRHAYEKVEDERLFNMRYPDAQ